MQLSLKKKTYEWLCLGIGIAKNNPFMDGNKRTSFLLMYVFLSMNGFKIETSENDVVQVMLKVADGSIKESALAKWLEKKSIPIE